MAIVLGLIRRLELLEPEICFELEDAIDELDEGLGVLGFQFERKRF